MKINSHIATDNMTIQGNKEDNCSSAHIHEFLT